MVVLLFVHQPKHFNQEEGSVLIEKLNEKPKVILASVECLIDKEVKYYIA